MGEEKKAWDLKDLEAKLKESGMPHIEGMARSAVESVFAWIEESVKLSPSKIDDLALAVVGPIKSWVLAKVDQISQVDKAPE